MFELRLADFPQAEEAQKGIKVQRRTSGRRSGRFGKRACRTGEEAPREMRRGNAVGFPKDDPSMVQAPGIGAELISCMGVDTSACSGASLMAPHTRGTQHCRNCVINTTVESPYTV